MILKKFLTCGLIICFVSSTLFTAYADETEEISGAENEETWLAQQLRDVFGELEFSLAQVPDNAVALNFKYANLQMQINDNGYGENYEITLPDSIEVSNDAAALFEEKYGNIDFSMDEVEIPDDFNVTDFLSTSKDFVSGEYENFINSENYQNIFDAVSTSTVTQEINDKLSGPDAINSLIANSVSLQTMMLDVGYNDEYADYSDFLSSQYGNDVHNHLQASRDKKTDLGLSRLIKEIQNQVAEGASVDIDEDFAMNLEAKANEYFGTSMGDQINSLFKIYHNEFDKSKSSGELNSNISVESLSRPE